MGQAWGITGTKHNWAVSMTDSGDIELIGNVPFKERRKAIIFRHRADLVSSLRRVGVTPHIGLRAEPSGGWRGAGITQHKEDGMKQGYKAENWVNKDGFPAGGSADGVGIAIGFQDGPLGRDGERIAPNGAFVEDLIDIVIQRIQFYQTTAERKFACRENAIAITKLEEAGLWLDKRTRDREARQVEGTHEA